MFDQMKTTLQRVKEAHRRHQVRRIPSGFDFALFDRISMVRADHWDFLTQGHSVCLSRPFLEVLESCAPEGLKPHYALIYRGDVPVAAVSAQSLEVSAASIPRGHSARPRLDQIKQRTLASIQQRILVCGNLLSWGPHGTAFAPGEDPGLLWPAVAEALYRLRRADKLFGDTDLIMVKDLPGSHPETAENLRRFSYRPLETEPNMVLELKPTWTTFEAYLKDMKSDYRSGIKKQLRDIEEAGLEVVSLDADQVEIHAREIHELYLQVQSRQRARLVTIREEWIPGLAKRFGADFRTTVIRPLGGGPLVGFVTCLRDGEGSIGYYIGFDRRTAEKAPLYLRLLYAIVEDGIALGAGWISLGRTALQPKAKLGAKPQATYCLLRHRIQALNLVVGSLLKTLPDPEEAPERNPFK